MPVARLQRLSEPPSGVLPDDLPPAGDEAAPLLSDAPSMFDEPSPSAVSAVPETTEGARARQEVGRRHGVDLSTVRVDRSQEGASAATQLRARAFTTASGVVIPRQEGTLETGPGEALLAHELTHVAQRMRLGPNVPDESSAAGRVLEQEAATTELTFNTGGRPPAGLAPPTGSLNGREIGTRGTEALPLAPPVAPGPDTDILAASILEKLSSLGTVPATGAPAVESVSTTWTSSVPSVAAAGAVQRAATDTAPPQAAQGASGMAGSTSATSSGAERPSDQELANLTKWLYPLIKHRLKGDLREDRERAGLLTDHYRKW
jgi:hypothetical protein